MERHFLTLIRPMLVGLTIRDIVLIDRLELQFRRGLSVLTGETGAGKSILLDALGLALGARGDAGLVRHGAEQGSVAAAFELPATHPVEAILREQDLPVEPVLLLRRMIGADGRGRAYVNDQPASVGLLRRIGESLVEVHGQHDDRGLLNPAAHRQVLDAFGGLDALRERCRAAFDEMRRVRELLAEAEAGLAEARRDEDYLRHVLAELEALDPKPGEEAELAEQRALLMQGEKIAEALNEARAALGEEPGIERALRVALRALERVAEAAGGHLDAALGALAGAGDAAAEAVAEVERAADALDLDPRHLERIAERLFALRDAARKHRTDAESLIALRHEFAARLAELDNGGDRLRQLQQRAVAARDAYRAAATALHAARRKAAARLDRAVAREMKPLKLDRAMFRTAVEPLDEPDWTPEGADRVAFRVATNPGTPLGPLNKIASGGELSRFMLALKVALAETRGAATLVFDEVDSGVGGAVADKVGERLHRLAQSVQVLVVTHSPQVASRGAHHWRVSKQVAGDTAVTRIEALDETERREEIARMLAGAEVTDEARAAAGSLIQAGRA